MRFGRKTAMTATAALAAAILFALPSGALAQNKTIEKKKQEAGKLQEDIKFLDKQISETKKQRENTLSELKLINKKVDTRKKLIERLEEDIKRQSDEISGKTRAIEIMNARLDSLKASYKRMIIKAYRNRDTRKWFMYIIASENVEQGYRRWSYLKKYSASLSEMAKQIKEDTKRIEGERSELSHLQAEKIKDQQATTEEYNKLKKDQDKSKAYANTLAKQQKKYAQELQKKKQQADRLNKEIERLISQAIASERKKAAEAAKKSGTSKTGSSSKTYSETPESAKLSGSFESNKGNIPWPVKKGMIVEGFGSHPHPSIKGVMLPFNNGVNIAAPKGSQVFSVFEGVVKQIIVIPGYSHCVLIEHGKFFTFYCKLGKVSVKNGQKVAQGTLLGTIDNNQESPEIHFELWMGTQKQNPENWLKK
ncbi:MAG: peptidoglycan DD-metalloendopeptidase family protein [Bacteroidales bacterium]|nr:peptidoglycan DD-metalloendopeptidase family protein [Bacteroidales bacterium]